MSEQAKKYYFTVSIKTRKVIKSFSLDQLNSECESDYTATLEDTPENRKFVMMLTRLCIQDEVITNVGYSYEQR